jgi:CubicO group peptidase (beta-lactamase class C family)
LIEERRLAWSTPLRVALAHYLKANGPPADPRALGITIEELVLHRAGFSSRPKDALTTLTLRDFLEKHTARETQFGPLLAATLRHPLASLPSEHYAYSNAGYLALGAIIEEATNETYESACRSRVLSPLGAESAKLDPSWRVLSSYGGWSMSGADYLKFFQVFAPNYPLLSADIRAWMSDRRGKAMSSQGWYGLGVRIDPVADGRFVISHTGAWPWTQPVAKDGPLASSTGAFVVRYPDGTTLFAAFWPIPRDTTVRNKFYNSLIGIMRETNGRLHAGQAVRH